MPTYHLRCPVHGDYDEHAPIAEGAPKVCTQIDFEQVPGDQSISHPCEEPVVQVLHSPAIHGVGPAGKARKKDAELDRDRAAYKRLRRDGLQPKTFRGAAELEARATERFEVERNVIVENKAMRDQIAAAHSAPLHDLASA